MEMVDAPDIVEMMNETFHQIIERHPGQAITGLFELTAHAIAIYSIEYGWSKKDIDSIMTLGRSTMYETMGATRAHLMASGWKPEEKDTTGPDV